MKEKLSRRFMIVGTLFSVCLIASNLLEIKVVDCGFMTVTAGMSVFPISYILNDCMVEVWGFRKACFVIWMGFAMNFLVMILGGLATFLPSPDYWDGAVHFNYMFSLAPRIVAASLTAFLLGSFLNAFVMSRMKKASGGRHFSFRAIASTVIGECADSLVFFPIAFIGLMPSNELLKMMAVQACLKTLIEVVVLPITTQLVKYLKRTEETDTFDENISYNPFKLS